ncbi:hypothetical protein FQR65_LT12610 [Abscondita terminalis]|nr:hypothetical protein FQR65_LT12610 [Abscondita terminalis]
MYSQVVLVVLLQICSIKPSPFVDTCSNTDVKLIEDKYIDLLHQTGTDITFAANFDTTLDNYEAQVKEILSVLRTRVDGIKTHQNLKCLSPLQTVISNLESKLQLKISAATEEIREKLNLLQTTYETVLHDGSLNEVKLFNKCGQKSASCLTVESCCMDLLAKFKLLKHETETGVQTLRHKYNHMLHQIPQIAFKVATYLNEEIGQCSPKRPLLPFLLNNDKMILRKRFSSEEFDVDSNESISTEDVYRVLTSLKGPLKRPFF